MLTSTGSHGPRRSTMPMTTTSTTTATATAGTAGPGAGPGGATAAVTAAPEAVSALPGLLKSAAAVARVGSHSGNRFFDTGTISETEISPIPIFLRYPS